MVIIVYSLGKKKKRSKIYLTWIIQKLRKYHRSNYKGKNRKVMITYNLSIRVWKGSIHTGGSVSKKFWRHLRRFSGGFKQSFHFSRRLQWWGSQCETFCADVLLWRVSAHLNHKMAALWCSSLRSSRTGCVTWLISNWVNQQVVLNDTLSQSLMTQWVHEKSSHSVGSFNKITTDVIFTIFTGFYFEHFSLKDRG